MSWIQGNATARADAGSTGVVASPAELVQMRHAARGLDLGPAIRVETPLAGPYPSPFRGRGLDFDEVRAYQPGDDVRQIDWRVTARTGRVHSKIFHEEHDRPLWLLLDAGTSGAATSYSSGSALHLAARNGHSACTRLLLMRGVPLDARSSWGCSTTARRRTLRGMPRSKWSTTRTTTSATC